MHWKFLLLGITGNLAKIKILPGLAQFAFLNKEKVSVELVGYSRSLPDLAEVERALKSGLANSKNSDDISDHNLTNISFVQGDYADGSILFDMIANLAPNERLVAYLAVPPSTFIKFLQNACPFSQNPLDIIVEKPFGRDPLEAEKMLNLVNSCSLQSQVHFCDHYLFKNSTLPTSEQLQQIQDFFETKTSSVLSDSLQNNLKSSNSDQHLSAKKLTNSPSIVADAKLSDLNQSFENSSPEITQIHLQILEKVDLAGRAGYFDSIGALKDMWPHLFSLLDLTLETTSLAQNLADLTTEQIVVQKVHLGQYHSYCQEAGLEDSTTETYFWLQLQLGPTEVILESGKNLPTKLTQIDVVTASQNNKVKKMTWNIYPEQTIKLVNLSHDLNCDQNDQDTLGDLPSKPKTESEQILNLDKDKLDQTNLFELLLTGNKERFVSPTKITKSWQIWQKINDFIDQNQVKIQVYPDQTSPKID